MNQVYRRYTAQPGDTVRILHKHWIPEQYYDIIGEVIETTDTNIRIRTKDNQTFRLAHGNYAKCRGA